MNMTDRFEFDLQLFADGAAAGESGTAEGTNTGVTEAAAALQNNGRKNPLANVQYGIQDEEQPPVAEAEEKAPDRESAFEEMIKGEYKDLFERRMREAVQKRLKGTKDTVDRYKALTPVVEMLERRYGVKAGDAEALREAIEEDNSYYEAEAAERGMPVEQYKLIKKMEMENRRLRQDVSELESRENASRLYRQWLEQEQTMRQVYPQFDLQGELENEQFLQLMRSGVDMRTAYEVIHKDEIIPAAMQFAAKTAERKVVNKIRANGSRPMENGGQDQSASLAKTDVSQLSKADRDEIVRRVERGEKIRF